MHFDCPPQLLYEPSVSEFLDDLVDSDTQYMDVLRAMEAILTGIILEPKHLMALATPKTFENHVIYLHRFPRFFDLPHLWVAFTYDPQQPLIHVIAIELEQ